MCVYLYLVILLCLMPIFAKTCLPILFQQQKKSEVVAFFSFFLVLLCGGGVIVRVAMERERERL